MVAVTSGLQAGDRVVVDGSDRLRDGMSVKVAGAPAASGPADGAGNTGTHHHHGNGAYHHAQP